MSTLYYTAVHKVTELHLKTCTFVAPLRIDVWQIALFT